MKASELAIGRIVTVSQDVWREWCIRNQKDITSPPEQPITAIPAHEPYNGYVMLAFPFYWWKAEELEPVFSHDFACQKCQGIFHGECPIEFCPECGE